MTTILDSANREFTKSVKKSNNPGKLMDKETRINSSTRGNVSSRLDRIQSQQ